MWGTQLKAICPLRASAATAPRPLSAAMDWRASSSTAARPSPDTDW